jgi:two-component system nitrate/nitrite response regulator NarL
MPLGSDHVDAMAVGERPAVYIVSDVRLVRDGLAWQLQCDGRLDIKGAGRPNSATLAALFAAPPAAVVLDLGVTGGLPFARKLHVDLPATCIIGFAVGECDDALAEWARTGICGYVERDGSAADIVATILHALRGELFCSPRFAAQLLAQFAAQSRAQAPAATGAPASLTPREQQILQFIGTGASNKDIARGLGISVATVKNHVHHLFEKLSVRRRSQASALFRGQSPHP